MRKLLLTSYKFQTGEEQFEDHALVAIDTKSDSTTDNEERERATDAVLAWFKTAYPESTLSEIRPHHTILASDYETKKEATKCTLHHSEAIAHDDPNHVWIQCGDDAITGRGADYHDALTELETKLQEKDCPYLIKHKHKEGVFTLAHKITDQRHSVYITDEQGNLEIARYGADYQEALSNLELMIESRICPIEIVRK